MASCCEVTGRRPGSGKAVSHSHRRTPRRLARAIAATREMALLPHPASGER